MRLILDLPESTVQHAKTNLLVVLKGTGQINDEIVDEFNRAIDEALEMQKGLPKITEI